MDVTGMNELSQGNTMLHQMREYNAGTNQHNLGVESEFNQKITDAQTGLRNMAGDDYAEKLTESIGGGVGLQGVKAGKQVYSAYKVASNETGFNELGSLQKAGKVAGQTFADAPIGKGVKALGEGAKTVGGAVTSATNPFTTAKYVKTGSTSSFVNTNQPAEGTLGPDYGGRDPSAGALGGREVGVAGGPEASATSTSLGRVGGPGTANPVELKTGGPLGDPDAPTIAPKSALPSSAEGVTQDAKIGGALEKAGSMAEGLGQMAQGLGVVQGGIDAVKDISNGHVAGANHEEKAGNVLGMVGGALDLAGFVVPGLGLLGAVAGIGSAIEGEVGQEKQAKTMITKTLPGEEQAQMTKAGPSAGATASSSGQVSSTQSSALSKIGGGSSAF